MVKRLLFLIAFFAANLAAEMSYWQLESQSVLPELVKGQSVDKQFAWVKRALSQSSDREQIYLLNRWLFRYHFNKYEYQAARNLCEQSPPLTDDYIYRRLCITVAELSYAERVPKLLQLAQEAKGAGHLVATIDALRDVGWRQSQNGDVAEAFATYQEALSLTPEDNMHLLFNTLFDTASVYIVHGDKEYVHKGIVLLEKIRTASLQALKGRPKQDDSKEHHNNFLLASFNIGIAYMLHLSDYSLALKNFEDVLSRESEYRLDALSFSALAAAQLGMFDKARDFLEQAGEKRHVDPLVDGYLQCYRALARRHWDKNEPLEVCLNLDPDTTIEVTLDVYRRMARVGDNRLELKGLRKFLELYDLKIEPELKRKASKAASNTELKRLQVESDLNSEILEKERALKMAVESEKVTQKRLFYAVLSILLLFILLIFSQLRQKLKLARQFKNLSLRDSLTNLGNRRYLEYHIVREMAFIDRLQIQQDPAVLGIFLMDIDHFKRINDNYSHQTGDAVLVEFCQRIRDTIRQTDIFIRWGGEEFVVVARMNSNVEIAELASRMVAAINSTPFDIAGQAPFKVATTIGAVQYPFFISSTVKTNWHHLISLADMALYWGKTQQRDCWVTVNNSNVFDEVELLEVIKRPIEASIKNKQLVLMSSIKQASDSA